MRKAQPASEVEILGLNSVPRERDTLTAVHNEQQANALLEKRQKEMRASLASKPVSLSNLFDQVSTGRVKELNIILKTDVQGSIEPIRSSLEQLATDEVKVRVIRSSSGNITESDVMLAAASKGVIIGFTTGSEPGARRLAVLEGISIRHYDVIYNLVDDISSALKGMLEPVKVEVIEGRAEVRVVFPAGKKVKVVGVYVTEGKISRGASVRVRRRDEIVSESTVNSLKRFKDDVREVATGYECGVGVKDFNEFEVGDILELFRIEETG